MWFSKADCESLGECPSCRHLIWDIFLRMLTLECNCRIRFEWDAGLAALTLPKEAAKNLTGSSEMTADRIAALVDNTSATSVIVTRHNVVVKDAAHSKDVMERAGFAWDVKLQGWHMPCAAALRFLRAHSITDANPEAVCFWSCSQSPPILRERATGFVTCPLSITRFPSSRDCIQVILHR